MPNGKFELNATTNGDFGFDEPAHRLWVAPRGTDRVLVHSLTGSPRRRLKQRWTASTGSPFSPDGRHLFVAGSVGLRRIDFHAGPALVHLGTGPASSPHVADDGMLVATWTTGELRELRMWRNTNAPGEVGRASPQPPGHHWSPLRTPGTSFPCRTTVWCGCGISQRPVRSRSFRSRTPGLPCPRRPTDCMCATGQPWWSATSRRGYRSAHHRWTVAAM